MSTITSPRAAALGIGFGTSVSMWAIGFVARLSPGAVPSAVLAVVMLACLIGAGVRAGRLPGLGAGTGALAGAVASLVNLLILGSVLGGGGSSQVLSSAMFWGPGSILFGAAAGALGATIGGRLSPSARTPDWTAELARVAGSLRPSHPVRASLRALDREGLVQ